MKAYLLLILPLFFQSLLYAATITVTTTIDEDDGMLGGGAGISLREAIRYSVAGDVIELAANATYVLTRASASGQHEGLDVNPSIQDLDIEKNLTINGNGATIDGNRSVLSMDTDKFNEVDRVMQIVAGVTVVINNPTITNGRTNIRLPVLMMTFSKAFGGGIYNEGTLTLNNCTISNCITNNSSTGNGHGGGIYNKGSLTMTNCTVSGNQSGTSNFGNDGGGIYNDNGTLILNKCTISGNTTIININSGGEGGGIYSTKGKVELTNCTISGNTGDRFAGGLGIVEALDQNSFINFCTIVNNYTNGAGGGLTTDKNSKTDDLVRVSNSIIANNTATNTEFSDLQNVFINDGYNLVGRVPTNEIIYGFLGLTDIFATHPSTVDPNIGPLQNNGGSTLTHALLNPSPAYNAANPSSTVTEDQTGTMRPQLGRSDMGAFESTVVLPVELLTFKGTSTGKSVILKWQTASEINNAGFEIERSKDAKHFETIGFVAGKGNTTELTNYQFTDDWVVASLQYYRLKQTDFDGSFEYSNIIAVSIKNDTDKTIRLSPNPVRTSFTIENGVGLGVLYNGFGQVVQQIQITDDQQVVEMSHLTEGIYWLQTFKADGTSQSIQIIKMQ